MLLLQGSEDMLPIQGLSVSFFPFLSASSGASQNETIKRIYYITHDLIVQGGAALKSCPDADVSGSVCRLARFRDCGKKRE